NRAKLLNKVLKSLINQSYKVNNVFIIDNNSSDNTEEIVRSFETDKFYYHNTFGNYGGAGGFYEGFKLAEEHEYDYLWLMDDDCVPAENCLEELLSSSRGDIIQPVRFNLDGSCAELSPVNYDLRKILAITPKLTSVTDIFNRDNDELIDIHGIPFEGPLISKKVINCIGYPNPKFFIFNDDLDYSIRARNYGFKIVCNPKASAIRLLKNSQINDLNSWKGYFMLRNHFYILRTYGENIFVCLRPIAIVFYLTLTSLVKLRPKTIKTVWSAFFDSFSLRNNDKNKPV
uniref:glycosyltransferase family 2 protein n=1 Tax=Vibrio hyugaensis TaxID=1534743 RepID=UPI000CE44C58